MARTKEELHGIWPVYVLIVYWLLNGIGQTSQWRGGSLVSWSSVVLYEWRWNDVNVAVRGSPLLLASGHTDIPTFSAADTTWLWTTAAAEGFIAWCLLNCPLNVGFSSLASKDLWKHVVSIALQEHNHWSHADLCLNSNVKMTPRHLFSRGSNTPLSNET